MVCVCVCVQCSTFFKGWAERIKICSPQILTMASARLLSFFVFLRTLWRRFCSYPHYKWRNWSLERLKTSQLVYDKDRAHMLLSPTLSSQTLFPLLTRRAGSVQDEMWVLTSLTESMPQPHSPSDFSPRTQPSTHQIVHEHLPCASYWQGTKKQGSKHPEPSLEDFQVQSGWCMQALYWKVITVAVWKSITDTTLCKIGQT